MLALIIYGWSTTNHKVGQGGFQCPVCRGQRACDVVQPSRWLTIYFIPIIPLGRSKPVLECQGCRGEFSAPDEITRRHPTTNPLPWVLGIGGALCVAFLMLVGLMVLVVGAAGSKARQAAKSKDPQKQVAIEFDPKTGEIIVPKDLGSTDNAKGKSSKRKGEKQPLLPSRPMLAPDQKWTPEGPGGIPVDGADSPIWKMKADPPAKRVTLSVAKDFKLPVPSGDLVFFPDGPSTLVGVRRRTPEYNLELWDLNQGKQVSAIAELQSTAKQMHIDAEGKVVALDRPSRRPIAWQVSPPKKFELQWFNPAATAHPKAISTMPGGKVLAVSDSSQELMVWDPASDGQLLQMSLPRDTRPAAAVSPGGRYVAFGSREGQKLWIADLTANETAARIPLPKPRGPEAPERLDPAGFAFSPDGTKLAGVFEERSQTFRMLIWDLESGAIKSDGFITNIRGRDQYRGPAVEWIDDSAFMLLGRVVFTARCELMGLTPRVLGVNEFEPRRAINQDSLLVVGDDSLEVRPLIETRPNSPPR